MNYFDENEEPKEPSSEGNFGEDLGLGPGPEQTPGQDQGGQPTPPPKPNIGNNNKSGNKSGMKKPSLGQSGPISKDPFNKNKGSNTAQKARQARNTAKSAKKTVKNTKRALKALVRAVRMAIKTATRLIRVLWPVIPFILVLIIMVTVVFGSTSLIAAIGEQADQLFGKGTYEKVTKNLTEKELKELRKEIGDSAAAALDCSNIEPAERRPAPADNANCIEGLIASFQKKQDGYFSPIPKSASWLVPVYRGAGKNMGIPWQVLGAINGSRSSFGKFNCSDQPNSKGVGFMRTKDNLWAKYAVNAGSSKVERSTATGGCQTASEPAYIKKDYRKKRDRKKPVPAHPRANYFEATDAIYTEANTLLAYNGNNVPKVTEWNYKGSGANGCTASAADGPISYPPVPTFDISGSLSGIRGNGKTLVISNKLIALGDYYKKKFGKPSPSSTGAIPKKKLIQMLNEIWLTFGASKRQAKLNAAANYKQVMSESGGRPAVVQGIIDVNSGGNEAGGLFQFIPGTFDTWAVKGFNDRFNAVDNLLAGVNAQVNSDTIYTTGAIDGGGSRQIKVLAGQGGWGPSGGSNPYLNKNKVRTSGASASPDAKPHPYRGKDQTDSLSKAMLKQGYSPCYVAIIHDWYKLILKFPPQEEVSAGLLPGGVKRVYKPKKYVKCPGKAGVNYDTSNACIIDARILANTDYLMKTYDIYISDGYSGQVPGGVWAGCSGCHASDGEHPLAVAEDINPGPKSGGSWDKITKLANLTEPQPDVPKPPFRWVGYDGDANHGAGNHLHLSWDHAEAAPETLADWVLVFGTDAAPGGKGKAFNASAGSGGGGGTDAKGAEVVIQAAPILAKKGFDHKAIAGILGNAYGESVWDPKSMEPGTDNGGLFGFTTYPVSMAALRDYAKKKGKSWANVGVQVRFMLRNNGHDGIELRGELNALGSIPETTKYFMDNWEKPNAAYAHLDKRIDGGFKASKIMRQGN